MRSLRWILVAVILTVGVLLVLQRLADRGEVVEAAPFVGPKSSAPDEPASNPTSERTLPRNLGADDSIATNDFNREEVPLLAESSPQRISDRLVYELVGAQIVLEGRVFGHGYDLTSAEAIVIQKLRDSYTTTAKVNVDEWGRFKWMAKRGTARTESLSVGIEHPTMRCRPVVVAIDEMDERWSSLEPLRVTVELESVLPCTLHGVARTMAPNGQMLSVSVYELRHGQPVLPAVATLASRREREVEFEFEVPSHAKYAVTATSRNTRPTTKAVEVGGLLSIEVGVLELDAGAEFSGHLIVDGRPVANANVVAYLGGFEIFDLGHGSAGLAWRNGEFECKTIRTTTDVMGHFSFGGATLGDYEIEVGQGGETVCIGRSRTAVVTPVDDVQIGVQLRRIEVEILGRRSLSPDDSMLVIDRTLKHVETSWALDTSGRTTFYAEPGKLLSLTGNGIERHSFTVRDHERITLDVSSED